VQVIAVTSVRVQTIVVLAALLILLLQLPRLDDPPELRLVGSEIDRVAEVRGGALYVELEGHGPTLVYVTGLRMHEDPTTGTAYVTRLDGMTLGNGHEPEAVSVDSMSRATALGWRPVSHLDGLVLPANHRTRHPYEFRILRLRKAINNGQNVLLVVGRLEGLDLVTERVVSDAFSEKDTCPAIPFLECVSVPGTGECFWALTGTVCWEGGQEPSLASVAWTAGYGGVD
jgi:hypothetical protein